MTNHDRTTGLRLVAAWSSSDASAHVQLLCRKNATKSRNRLLPPADYSQHINTVVPWRATSVACEPLALEWRASINIRLYWMCKSSSSSEVQLQDVARMAVREPALVAPSRQSWVATWSSLGLHAQPNRQKKAQSLTNHVDNSSEVRIYSHLFVGKSRR
jgi:hypothetical protein